MSVVNAVAWIVAVVGVRCVVVELLRKVVAAEDRDRAAALDREWAAVEPRWSGR
jgi:hypothetical protein